MYLGQREENKVEDMEKYMYGGQDTERYLQCEKDNKWKKVWNN